MRKSNLLLICLFVVASCNAQIWQNFKGIRLVNESDTTEQLSVEGSIYYDDDARKFYGRNQWGWKEFSLGGGGGGAFWPLSGTGTLTGPTIITTNGNSLYTNYIGGSGLGLDGAFTFDPSADSYLSFYDPDDIAATRRGFRWTAYDNSIDVVVPALSQGLKYTADISANFTDLSIPNWGATWKANGTSNIGQSFIQTDENGIISIAVNDALLDSKSTIYMQGLGGAVQINTLGNQSVPLDAFGGDIVASTDGVILSGVTDGSFPENRIFLRPSSAAGIDIEYGMHTGTSSLTIDGNNSGVTTFQNVDSLQIVNGTDKITFSAGNGGGLSRITFTDGAGDIGYVDFSSVNDALNIGRSGADLIRLDANNNIILNVTRTDCTGAPSNAIYNDGGILKICP